MSLFEANLRLLAERHPQACRALERELPGEGRVRVVPTPSGAPTAILGGISVHSRRDPRKEAAAQVESETARDATAAIILGFGLGYAAEAFRERFPPIPALVIEPDVEMFRAAVSSRNLSGILSDGKTSFLVGAQPEEAAAMLEALPLAKPSVFSLRPAREKNPAWFHAMEEVLQSFLLRRDVNAHTLTRFGRLWVRNLGRNLEAFLGFPGVALLEGMFSGFPALVVAGGPSFDDIAPRLRELAERLLIVSVNTSLAPCLEAGVRPDFAVVVDPQYWASRYLDWTEPGVIVAEPSTHPRVFHRTGSRFFLCSSLFPLGERLESVVGEKGKLGAGGSVATSAWDLARLLGASPVYTAGLDLGFPGMRTHCRGVSLEELWHSLSGRLSPSEGASFRALREIGVFPTASASGGVTATDRRMLIYKWWFENQLAMRPGARSFTLSGDSAAIRGMPLARVEEVLDLPPVRAEIDARMRRVKELSREGAAGPEVRRMLREALGDVLAGLTELEKLSRRGLSLTAELEKALARGGDPGGSIRELDRVDRGILEVSDRSIAGFLLQSLIHGIEARGEGMATREEVLARSSEMYRGIAESAGWQSELLARARRTIG